MSFTIHWCTFVLSLCTKYNRCLVLLEGLIFLTSLTLCLIVQTFKPCSCEWNYSTPLCPFNKWYYFRFSKNLCVVQLTFRYRIATPLKSLCEGGQLFFLNVYSQLPTCAEQLSYLLEYPLGYWQKGFQWIYLDLAGSFSCQEITKGIKHRLQHHLSVCFSECWEFNNSLPNKAQVLSNVYLYTQRSR